MIWIFHATSIFIFFLALSMLEPNKVGWADDQKPDAKPYQRTWRMVAVTVDGKDHLDSRKVATK